MHCLQVRFLAVNCPSVTVDKLPFMNILFTKLIEATLLFHYITQNSSHTTFSCVLMSYTRIVLLSKVSELLFQVEMMKKIRPNLIIWLLTSLSTNYSKIQGSLQVSFLDLKITFHCFHQYWSWDLQGLFVHHQENWNVYLGEKKELTFLKEQYFLFLISKRSYQVCYLSDKDVLGCEQISIFREFLIWVKCNKHKGKINEKKTKCVIDAHN